jgi:hypothetical protein
MGDLRHLLASFFFLTHRLLLLRSPLMYVCNEISIECNENMNTKRTCCSSGAESLQSSSSASSISIAADPSAIPADFCASLKAFCLASRSRWATMMAICCSAIFDVSANRSLAKANFSLSCRSPSAPRLSLSSRALLFASSSSLFASSSSLIASAASDRFCASTFDSIVATASAQMVLIDPTMSW